MLFTISINNPKEKLKKLVANNNINAKNEKYPIFMIIDPIFMIILVFCPTAPLRSNNGNVYNINATKVIKRKQTAPRC
jgi:hypothetical protein